MANQIYRVRGVGGVGVIKDTPPFENPSNAWTDANNIRFRKSSIEKMGGYFPVLTDEMPNEAPLVVFQRGNTEEAIYATSENIYLIQGNNHSKINATGTTYNATPAMPWFYTTLSGSVVLNNEQDVPQGMTPIESIFKPLPGWGKPNGDTGATVDWRCKAIRAYKNYLVALNMSEAGTDYPQRVRWSDVSYVNDLPNNWIENDITKDGGFNDLSDCTGSIIDGIPLRDSFVIYTEHETYLMNFVGGTMVFTFNKLFSDSGILAPECAVEFEGKHFVISQNDIFIHNGTERQPVASGRTKDYLIEEISSVNPKATKVVTLPHMKEVWICYVSPGQSGLAEFEGNEWEDSANWDDGEVRRGEVAVGQTDWACTRAAVWNWEYDTWSFYDLPRTYDINLLLPPTKDSRIWEAYTDENRDEWASIAQEEEQWENMGRDFVRKVLWVASIDKCLYVLDEGLNIKTYNSATKQITSRPLLAFIERTNLDFDDAVEYTRVYKLIKEIIPQFQGFGKIDVRVGGSPNPSAAPTWDETQTFDIEEDTKVDFYSNHRYPAIRFEDFGQGDWKLSGYDLIFTPGGSR